MNKSHINDHEFYKLYKCYLLSNLSKKFVDYDIVKFISWGDIISLIFSLFLLSNNIFSDRQYKNVLKYI